MTTQSIDLAVLESISHCLAEVIDEYSGEFPFIKIIDGSKSPTFIWEYGNFGVGVIIRPKSTKAPRLLPNKRGWIEVKSVEEALEAVRLTEGLRQHTEMPYVQLTPMRP